MPALEDAPRLQDRRQTLRALTLGYFVALAILGAVAATAHVVTGLVIESQSANAMVVNVSGRQRMLSQRIAMLADAWLHDRRPEDRMALTRAVDLFERSHHGLLRGNASMGLPASVPDAVRRIYLEAPLALERKVTAFVALARATDDAGNPDPAGIMAVVEMARGGLDDPQSLLFALNAVVEAFEAEHGGQIAHMKTIQDLALLALAVVLVLEALLIFRPLVNRVRRLTDQLHEAALVDPLSGLLNRRGFTALGDRLLRQRRPGAVIALDIDHFKRINDTLGHAAGDACIVHVATVMRDTLRDGDVIGRIGGEEFAAVLAGATREASVQAAERLRHALETRPCQLDDPTLAAQQAELTASLGVATFDEGPGQSLESLIQAADAAMYRAKHAGRNRVVAAPRPSDRPSRQPSRTQAPA